MSTRQSFSPHPSSSRLPYTLFKERSSHMLIFNSCTFWPSPVSNSSHVKTSERSLPELPGISITSLIVTVSRSTTLLSSLTQTMRDEMPGPSPKSSQLPSWELKSLSHDLPTYLKETVSTQPSTLQLKSGVGISSQLVPSSSVQVIVASTRHSFGSVIILYSYTSTQGTPSGGFALTVVTVVISLSTHTSIISSSSTTRISRTSTSLSSSLSSKSSLSPSRSRSNSVTVIGTCPTFSRVYV
mmetsp:Transcript_12233/g.18897  ORF Transcript_12233/g.18897 Transcript_12233/m.18897 type:complete len:241 (+) Transcript_12233:322-1044(+)